MSFIRALFVPHRTEAPCAVQKLEEITSSQRALHSKVDPLLQAADTLGMAAALQGNTQNFANECAQRAALQGDTPRMSLTSAPKVLRCKGTLRMALPSALKVLHSKETLPARK